MKNAETSDLMRYLRDLAEGVPLHGEDARTVVRQCADRLGVLTDIAGLFLNPASIDVLIATHAEWSTPMGFGLDQLMDLDVFDTRNLRHVLRGATLLKKRAAAGHADRRPRR